jgi:hypothetical protein
MPVFDPIAFFTGPSEGRGRVKILMRAPTSLAVHGSGRLMPDGSLVLDQRIERPGHAEKRRRWHISRLAPGDYRATLSSASGPVTVEVDGNLMRLDFREDKVGVHQDIILADDGRSALNHMRLTRFGLRVATIEERITRTSDRER